MTHETLESQLEEQQGRNAYLLCMLEQDYHEPGSVDWDVVYSALHEDALAVDEAQGNEAWEVWR
jgi:hypothetical protein